MVKGIIWKKFCGNKLLQLFQFQVFLFLCSVCNSGNEERLMRLSEELTLADMAHIALFNLTLDTTKKYHDLDMSILPFIENNWKYFNPNLTIYQADMGIIL